MQILSVPEFDKFCKNIKPSRYIYNTENQRTDNSFNTKKEVSEYKIVLTSLCPNIIFFRNEFSYMCLERVKYVLIDTETCTIGTVLTVVCGDKKTSDNDMFYTFIAD